VPLFFRRIALATVLLAAFPYLRPDFFELFLGAIDILLPLELELSIEVVAGPPHARQREIAYPARAGARLPPAFF
jgi:hypothetical protein